MATPQMRELALTAGSFTNQSNDWLYVYGSDTVTIVDGSGTTLDIQSLPAWLPPQFKITPTTAKTLMALAGSLEDFRGFLSKRPGGIVGNFALLTGGPSVSLSALTSGQDVLSETMGLVVGGAGANTPKGFIAQGGSETLSETVSVTVV